MTIYLDNAATTFPKPPSVVEAVQKCLETGAVNAGRGIYALALEADKLIHQTRLQVASLLNYPKGQTIFTPSATIALNQVLLGIEWERGDFIYITPFEHNSVARVVEQICKTYSAEIITIPVDQGLNYQMDLLEELFGIKPPKAVVMTHVSNVCGHITPVTEIARQAKKQGAIVVVDGAQAGPLLPLEKVEEIVDFYIFSGHKTFYGPFGIAGFVTHGQIKTKPILYGGTGGHSELLTMPEDLPYAYEVGSPNIVAIAGLQAACGWIQQVGPAQIVEHEQHLLDKLVAGLAELEEMQLYVSSDLRRHLGTLSFTVEEYTAQEIGMILSQEFDIAVRTGLHCSPLAHRFLGTLPHGTVRVGLGYWNTEQEIEILLQAIQEIIKV